MTTRVYFGGNLDFRAELSRITSLTETKYINSMGTFSIKTDYLPDNILVGDIIHTRGDDCQEYAGIITDITIKSDSTGMEAEIKGIELIGVLRDRIPIYFDAPIEFGSEYTEVIVKQLIYLTHIAPDYPKRQNPLVDTAGNHGYGKLQSFTADPEKSVLDNIYDAIKDERLGVTANLQLGVGGQIIIDVIQPADHSTAGERPVIISAKFDNLEYEQYLSSISTQKNVAYYSLQGENETVTYGSVEADESTGRDRKERWIAASQNNGLTTEQIISTIRMQLGNFKAVESISGGYQPGGLYTLGIDFRLGDIVEYVGDYGSATQQVIGYTQTLDSSGYTVSLLFGDNIQERINQIRRITNGNRN